jgi:hypothetical protein
MDVSSYSTTIAGKQYSGSVEESGGQYTASVPNLAGATASGSSLAAAESRRPFVGGNRLADQFDGNVIAAHLVSQHSQQVKTVSMMRIVIENLPVDSLRLRQLPTLMEANGIAAHAVQVNQRTFMRRVALPPGNKMQGAAHAASLCV